jgi:hypothetical protein
MSIQPAQADTKRTRIHLQACPAARPHSRLLEMELGGRRLEIL